MKLLSVADSVKDKLVGYNTCKIQEMVVYRTNKMWIDSGVVSMEEIRDIKKAVYVREIVFAVISGEYSFPINDIDQMGYEEIEQEYMLMAEYLRNKRSQAG